MAFTRRYLNRNHDCPTRALTDVLLIAPKVGEVNRRLCSESWSLCVLRVIWGVAAGTDLELEGGSIARATIQRASP